MYTPTVLRAMHPLDVAFEVAPLNSKKTAKIAVMEA